MSLPKLKDRPAGSFSAKFVRFLNQSAETCVSEVGLWTLVAVILVAALAGAEDIRHGELPRDLAGCFCGWVVACHIATALHMSRGDDDAAES